MRVLDPWEELDAQDWPRGDFEQRGKRTKWWCQPPGESRPWLLKRPHRRKFTAQDLPEAAIEAFTLRLARAAGLAAPRSVICRVVDDGEDVFAIATESFIDKEREELSLGAVELKGHDVSYQADDKVQHTPERVLALLRSLNTEATGILAAFFDLMLFDAWVGVVDRHPENWGVIRGGATGMRLAPIYDTASCLAVALADGHHLLARPSDDEIKKYADRCPSGFGDGQKLIALKNVTNFMLSQDECRRRLSTQVASFRAVMENVPLFLEGVPDGLLSEARKKLAARLLAIRLDLLEGCLT